jgi:hypothetical protein
MGKGRLEYLKYISDKRALDSKSVKYYLKTIAEE